MAWFVGIDEAGYGPNLGPMVQAAVAVEVPEGLDPWLALAPWLRRASEKDTSRVLVDDSKKVNSGKSGLAKLEAGPAAFLGLRPGTTLGEWLEAVGRSGTVDELGNEAWYDGKESLPLFDDVPSDRRDALRDAGIHTLLLGVKVFPAPIFNRIIAGSGTKATVTGIGVTSLLATIRTGLTGFERVIVSCDKLGGRNHYTPIVQAAFPEAWTVAELESAAESRYRIESLGRPVTVLFRPRADAESPATALASMTAKYLREVFMAQFNRWWQARVPDLAPTAGYPVDAKRFFAHIEPHLPALAVAKADVWREK